MEELAQDWYNEFAKRLWSAEGGVNTDFKNFCCSEDINWIREELENDSSYFIEENEEEYGSYECEEAIAEYICDLKNDIEEIESNLGFYKIVPHIENHFTRIIASNYNVEDIDNMFNELKETIQKAGLVDFDHLDEEDQEVYDEAVSLIEAKKFSLQTKKS